MAAMTSPAFLDRVTTALLRAPLDLRARLDRIARLLVPDLADACAVFLRDGDLAKVVAYAHRDPERQRLGGIKRPERPERQDDRSDVEREPVLAS